MIVDKGKYYLYRHVRLDKDIPFYIGLGTKTDKSHRTTRGEYARAYTFHKENSIWKNIVKKTEWKVEILCESNDLSFIKKKEEEFILLYGRINLKTGILANLTDGGESQSGRIGRPISLEHKKILSERMKINNPNKDGKFHPFSIPGVREKVIKRMRENNPRHTSSYVWNKKCFLYNTNGEFIKEFQSYKEASKYLNSTPNCVATYFKENRKIIKGFVLRRVFEGIQATFNLCRKTKVGEIIVFLNGKEYGRYSTIIDCLSHLPFSRSMIYKLLSKKNDTNEYMGYRVFYKNDTRIPMIIRDLSKEETLADLMQNNPDLTKEELLYWCPEFKNK